jgi:hypothetical protein
MFGTGYFSFIAAAAVWICRIAAVLIVAISLTSRPSDAGMAMLGLIAFASTFAAHRLFRYIARLMIRS